MAFAADGQKQDGSLDIHICNNATRLALMRTQSKLRDLKGRGRGCEPKKYRRIFIVNIVHLHIIVYL